MVGVWGEEEGGNFVSMRQNMSVFYFAGTPKTIITFYRWPQTILSTVFGTNALCLLIYKPKLNISKNRFDRHPPTRTPIRTLGTYFVNIQSSIQSSILARAMLSIWSCIFAQSIFRGFRRAIPLTRFRNLIFAFKVPFQK